MATTYMMKQPSCVLSDVFCNDWFLKRTTCRHQSNLRQSTKPILTSFMKENLKISGADIETLAKITFFSTAQVTAINGVTRFQNLAARQTNPALKKVFTSCLEEYNNTISSLDGAARRFNSGDGPALMKVKVSAAMKGPTTCQDGLAKFKADPSIDKRTRLSINYQDNFLDICGIILVIYDMM